MMAVSCLVIETLESFYEGLPDTRNRSAEMFRSFLRRETPLKLFGGGRDWFFTDIRCGLLHQGEVRGGWRIRRSGLLLDQENRTINAEAFVRTLSGEIARYAQALELDDLVWSNFKNKMKAVCENCLR